MKLINVACGSLVNKDWINIDFVATSEEVIQFDVLSDLPFADNEVDVIYCSHFIEHISRNEVEEFLALCFRKIKPGGIIRIVTPDLENICREYIRVCENEPNSFKHEWITVELIDQLTRTYSGGLMGQLYKDRNLPKPYRDYIYERVGEELNQEKSVKIKKRVTFNRIRIKILYLWLSIIQKMIPKNIRNQVFSNTHIGEKHRWMYDKYTLKALLEKTGFTKVESLNYSESNIPNFRKYLLDEKKDGSPQKGNSSIYIEAFKSSNSFYKP